MAHHIPNPENENYAAVVVRIKDKEPLPNLDNLVHTSIMGNRIIVSKDTEIGTKGLFFPPECQIDKTFLSKNNLFRHSNLNEDDTQSGFFEDKGRVKAIKLKGNVSEGFFIPMYALSYLLDDPEEIEEGTVFDQINKQPICKKYVVKRKQSGNAPSRKARKPKVSRLVNNQFRFHYDTQQIGRFLHLLNPERRVHISYKIHGTSAISSRVLCRKKKGPVTWFLSKAGVPLDLTYYDNIYASRKVIKNDDLNKNNNHFYGEDIWGQANQWLAEYLSDGMTVYYEIAGFLPSGGYLQKPYDYGTSPEHEITFRIFLYRMTYTNPSGEVFEFLPCQIEMWKDRLVRDRGLSEDFITVPPTLYEGRLRDLFEGQGNKEYGEEFVDFARDYFQLEDDCFMCNNQVPREGIVIRYTDVPYFDAYKLKGFRFLEKETKDADKGQGDFEEQQQQI